MADGGAEVAARVMKAVLSMDRLDMVELQKAFGAMRRGRNERG
jgi:hypothetical protein